MPADPPLPSYDELLALNAGLVVRLEQALARIAELEARLKQSSSTRTPPSAFGISTAFTGGGKYDPDDIRFQIL